MKSGQSSSFKLQSSITKKKFPHVNLQKMAAYMMCNYNPELTCQWVLFLQKSKCLDKEVHHHVYCRQWWIHICKSHQYSCKHWHSRRYHRFLPALALGPTWCCCQCEINQKTNLKNVVEGENNKKSFRLASGDVSSINYPANVVYYYRGAQAT
jgi:hypothetical protein